MVADTNRHNDGLDDEFAGLLEEVQSQTPPEKIKSFNALVSKVRPGSMQQDVVHFVYEWQGKELYLRVVQKQTIVSLPKIKKAEFYRTYCGIVPPQYKGAPTYVNVSLHKTEELLNRGVVHHGESTPVTHFLDGSGCMRTDYMPLQTAPAQGADENEVTRTMVEPIRNMKASVLAQIEGEIEKWQDEHKRAAGYFDDLIKQHEELAQQFSEKCKQREAAVIKFEEVKSILT